MPAPPSSLGSSPQAPRVAGRGRVALCALHGLLMFGLVYVPAVWRGAWQWLPVFTSVGIVCMHWLRLAWVFTGAWRIAAAPYATRVLFVVGAIAWLRACPTMAAVTLIRLGGHT